MKFETKGLWLHSLGSGDVGSHRVEKERLRSIYKRFWERAVQISNKIQTDLPDLTLHDESHYEALWDRADQIAGAKLAHLLTPLEVFVFGGAILLHDLGNTLAVYSNGIADIEKTPEWLDAISDVTESLDIADPNATSYVELPQAVRKIVLFNVLRRLHATRAEELGELSYTNLSTGTKNFLIDDDELRRHLGPLIGNIAASHNWDLSQLETRFKSRHVGSVAALPREWTIRPILLACLLRCADAAQIDQNRAPDFLYALLHVRGLSELHWRAQNLLAMPSIDPHDPKTMIFNSTRPYLEDDAEAWWIAHDAVAVAHSELQACSLLLDNLNLPSFAVDRVRNADSPSRLSEQIEVKGWRPVTAEVRVGKVSEVVTMLGGKQLYGNEPIVALRELIANAVDAVVLRRTLEPLHSGYNGSLTIRLTQGTDGQQSGHWLIVEDDGLGMSEAVLTGPLIDFGSSYVASDLAKKERPGLSARGRNRIGRYGIGFFSVFMLSPRVLVTSKPFDEGLSSCRTLSFRSGMTHRPLLLVNKSEDFPANLSTRVSVFLGQDALEDLLKIRDSFRQVQKKMNLSGLVGALCPTLDVDIYTQELSAARQIQHMRDWNNQAPSDWVKRICAINVREDVTLEEAVKISAPLLRPISTSDMSLGFAAINVTTAEAGVRTIGGVSAGVLGQMFERGFVGSIDCSPSGPQRSQCVPRNYEALATWATGQATLLKTVDLTPTQKQLAAIRIARFGGDPTMVANIRLDREFVSLEKVLRLLQSGETIYTIVQYGPVFQQGERSSIHIVSIMLDQRIAKLHLTDKELELHCHILEPIEVGENISEFYEVPVSEKVIPNSFIGCLERYALSRNIKLEMEIEEEVVVATYLGKASDRDDISTGSEIWRPCLKITIES